MGVSGSTHPASHPKNTVPNTKNQSDDILRGDVIESIGCRILTRFDMGGLATVNKLVVPDSNRCALSARVRRAAIPAALFV